MSGASNTQRWHGVIRIWAASGGRYVYRHDPGTTPTDFEPAVLVATLRALADDVEQRAGIYRQPPTTTRTTQALRECAGEAEEASE